MYGTLSSNYPFIIQNSWELLAILGDEATYNNLDLETRGWLNMAHYAAWSGNLERLNQVQGQRPDLFSRCTTWGTHAGCYAALSGNPDALQWIKDNQPHLLDKCSNSGCSIAHYAAMSGNPDMLKWIKEHRFHLLSIKNDYGKSIAMGAAFSGNEEQFNLALALSGNPREFFCGYLGSFPTFMRFAVPTLLRALKTNYTLTHITGLPRSQREPDDLKTIRDYLNDNQRIQKELKTVTSRFTLLMNEKNPQREPCLPRDILLNLFVQAVKGISERIPEKDIHAQFNRMYKISRPLMPHDGNHQVNPQALQMVRDKTFNLQKKTSGLGFFIDKDRVNSKIDALGALKKLMIEDEFTEDRFTAWYRRYEKTINQQTNTLTDRFFKTRETASCALVRKLCQDFGFNEKQLTEADQRAGYSNGCLL